MFFLVTVTEEAPTPPCLGNVMGSLWLTLIQFVAAQSLEGPHSRLTAHRVRLERNTELELPFILFNDCW